MLAKEIIIETLKQIQRDRVTATPEVYAKTFCIVAKKAGLDLEECRPAKIHIARLPEPLKTQATSRNIAQLDELIAFLIGAIMRGTNDKGSDKKTSDIVAAMKQLLAKAMTPSFSRFGSGKLNTTLQALDRNLALALDPNYRQRILELIGDRIRFDRSHISKEAGELKQSVQSLCELVETMRRSVSNKSGSLSTFSAKLGAIKPESYSKELFGELKNSLSAIADELSSEATLFDEQLAAKEAELAVLRGEINTMHAEMERLAQENTEDYLTQVQTKKMIDLKLAELEEAYEKSAQNYAILFFDIDFFKKINDGYGHEAGDKILQAFGATLKKLLPNAAIVGRYGGEEFVAIVLGAQIDEAVSAAEVVRVEIEKSRFEYRGDTIAMTVSCGVALRSESQSADGAMREADARLYSAKWSGRNKVVSRTG
ncbi:hypothetical protein AGMMS50229_09450 [Campylobacterota bacterium]|nr:hypothetical protein AGMMS50229_09450 [Campylobacterota bacterium]